MQKCINSSHFDPFWSKSMRENDIDLSLHCPPDMTPPTELGKEFPTVDGGGEHSPPRTWERGKVSKQLKRAINHFQTANLQLSFKRRKICERQPNSQKHPLISQTEKNDFGVLFLEVTHTRICQVFPASNLFFPESKETIQNSQQDWQINVTGKLPCLQTWKKSALSLRLEQWKTNNFCQNKKCQKKNLQWAIPACHLHKCGCVQAPPWWGVCFNTFFFSLSGWPAPVGTLVKKKMKTLCLLP